MRTLHDTNHSLTSATMSRHINQLKIGDQVQVHNPKSKHHDKMGIVVKIMRVRLLLRPYRSQLPNFQVNRESCEIRRTTPNHSDFEAPPVNENWLENWQLQAQSVTPQPPPECDNLRHLSIAISKNVDALAS